MSEEEIKIFEEFKIFLKEFNDGNYSNGDILDTLIYFSEKLDMLK